MSFPACHLLLQVMMDWLVKLCGLPDKFLCKPPSSEPNSSSNAPSNGNSSSSNGNSSSKSPGGVIQGTSSEAVLVAMLAARARAMAGRPAEEALKLVAYGTNQVRRRLLQMAAAIRPVVVFSAQGCSLHVWLHAMI